MDNQKESQYNTLNVTYTNTNKPWKYTEEVISSKPNELEEGHLVKIMNIVKHVMDMFGK